MGDNETDCIKLVHDQCPDHTLDDVRAALMEKDWDCVSAICALHNVETTTHAPQTNDTDTSVRAQLLRAREIADAFDSEMDAVIRAQNI